MSMSSVCRKYLSECDVTLSEFHAYCVNEGLEVIEVQVLGTLRNLCTKKEAERGSSPNTFRKFQGVKEETVKKRTKKVIVNEAADVIGYITTKLGSPQPEAGKGTIYGITLDGTLTPELVWNKAMNVIGRFPEQWSWKIYGGFTVLSFW